MEKFTSDTLSTPVDHDPFQGPVIEQAIPTTEAQREVFVAAEMGRDASCAYNEGVSLLLKGTLDADALGTALVQLVERHVSLRSTISISGTRMVVMETATPLMVRTDLSSLTSTERADRLKAMVKVDMTTPFDLLNGPLFRTQLIRCGAEEHMLCLTGHHVVCDGWSLGIIMAEISQLYNAVRSGTTAALPAAIPYSTYSEATIDFAKGPEHAQVEQYWADQFKGTLPHLDLPTDRSRPRQKTYSGDRLDLALPDELVRGLKEVATRSGASFVTTLLTSFELLLHKLTGDSDIIVGLPAAGQSDLGMKHLVGHCVNLLALRSRVDEDISFIDHLKQRRSAVLDAFDNQKYTFGTLLKKLAVPREPGRIPLVPVVFNIDMNMDDGVAFDGLQHAFISNPRAFENFELFLNATGGDGHLTLEWSYNTDLFDHSTVEGWMSELQRIIQRLILNPTATIGELMGEQDLAGADELPTTEWLGRSPAYPRDRNIGELFDEVATRHAERTALTFVDARLTYRELQQRVHALAEKLIAAGVRPGDPVGLCADRSFEMIAAMLAIVRCGAAFVPFDPAYPQERLQFMFDDTEVKLLLTQRHLSDGLPEHKAKLLFLEDLPTFTSSPGSPAGDPESLAYLMYTSGSTGRPKGVMVPQRAIVRLVREQNFLPFGPELVFLQLSNISFDASTLEIWGALLNGARLVLQPQQKPTLVEITDLIREQQVSTVWFTAGLFNLLVDDHLERLRGLKHILTGGDVLSVPHVKKAVKVLGPNVLINGYGPTENTTFTCCHPIANVADIKGSVPIGKPIHHTTVHVLDERMKPVPIGRKGELYAGGDGVALGYWKRPDLTAERFVRDPFSSDPNARLYRTGDLVRWLPSGVVEFVGRNDDQVKVRGFRIELGEIENAMDGAPGIKDRVVVARTEGHGEKQLACYVVPEDVRSINEPAAQDRLIATLREHLRARVPEHMVPAAFVVMESFPLNPNGKVDKKALPIPQYRTQTLRVDHVAPRDAMERSLASIWSQLLGLERVSVHDNFFELGGHSLIGIQLLAQVEEQFGRPLSLKDLFQAPTIAEFAQVLQEDGVTVNWENLSPIQPDGKRVPFFCVHGDEANYFIPKYLGNDQPFYAFFHQGEDGRRIQHTSVEAIATHFIQEMRTVRPRGPYLIGGYSFGGIVAYEMARQLTAAGEEVPLLALFDTYAPQEFKRVMKEEDRFYFPVKHAILRAAAGWYLKRNKPMPPKLRHFYIIDVYDKAIRNYKAGPYDGPLTVFKAEASTGPDHMGWSMQRKDMLLIRQVPGNHYDLVKEPNVKALAMELGKCIDDVLQKRAVEAV
ncbi:MAG: amino acid adenylation domain-containing protein [Flavobacteriales bacterium]|nr:amino acid adenylation domain-containing protein [Flavobacteriales bacterium]MBK9286221.1 amino acid adenylation domain-containing protein [Flavobacteriales bacterium]